MFGKPSILLDMFGTNVDTLISYCEIMSVFLFNW